jgi:predicted phage terminase large subunit-like protein
VTEPSRALAAILRTDLIAFVQKCFETVSGGDEYRENWHHGAMAWNLECVARGELHRLIISVPPRHLKSIIASVAWVAFMLGRNPMLRFVCVSYSIELALKHARDCRTIMQSDWYRELFPGTILSRTKNSEHDFETTRSGGRFSTSVSGTLTGRGGDIIILDDAMKPDQAISLTERRNVIEWFGGTLVSRLNSKVDGAIIVVAQRLHEEDLTGHLLEAGGWQHLCLPAIAEDDEEIQIGVGRFHRRSAGIALHPAHEPLDHLLRMKAVMGSAAFSCQYLQAPIPTEGVLVKREWLRWYDHPPERKIGDRIVQSWDCASEDGPLNDWSVCITALLRRRQVYLLDVYRARLIFPDLYKRAIGLARRHDITTLLIENAASGRQLIQNLRSLSPSQVPRPIACKPDGNKVTRMSGQTSRIEAGDLLLPREAPWLAEFERELLGFPSSRYDDQVDALVHLLAWASTPQRRLAIVGPEVGPPRF